MGSLVGLSILARFASLAPSKIASCIAFGKLLFLPPAPEGELSGDRFVPFDPDPAADFEAKLGVEVVVDAFAAGLAKYEEISLEAILILLRSIHSFCVRCWNEGDS